MKILSYPLKISLLLQLLLICSFSSAALASVPVTVVTSLQNKNWFPLEVSEMKSASVGAALHELTKDGDFQIVESGDSDNIGALGFEIILIERAQMVQVKITLSPRDSASFFTHASASLGNTDYQGIYEIFEHVGKHAATQLLERFHQHNARIEKVIQQMKPKPVDSVKQALKNDYSDLGATQLFEKAQEAKLQHDFDDAKKMFKALEALQGRGTESWKKLAKDELRYGLPLLRADVLTRTMQEKINSQKSITGIDSEIDAIYAEIIRNNPDKPERIRSTQAKRDQLQQMTYYINKASTAQSLSSLTILRIQLVEYMSSMGEFPKTSMVNEWLQSSRQTRDFFEVSRKIQAEELRITLQNKRDKSRYEVLAEKYDFAQARRL